MSTSPTPQPTTEDPNLGRFITFSPIATNAGPDFAGSDGSSDEADEDMSTGSIIGILIMVMAVLAVCFFVGTVRARRTKATTMMLMNDMRLQRRNSDVRLNRHDTQARRLSLQLDQASPTAPPSVPKTVWTTYINQASEPPAGIDRENDQYVPLDSYVDIGNNTGGVMAVDGEYMQQEVEGEGVEMLLDHVTLELTKGSAGGVDTYVSGLDTLLNRKKSRIAIPNDPGDWGELSHRRQSTAKKAKRVDQEAFDDEQLAGLNELICRLSEEQGDGSGLTGRYKSAAVPAAAQARYTPFSAINPGFEFEHSDMLEMEPDNDVLPHQRHRRTSGDSIVSRNAGYLDPVPYTRPGTPAATPTTFATAHGPVSTRNPGKLHSADRLASVVIMMDTPFWRSLPPTDPRQNQSGPAGNNLHFYPPIYPEPGATIQTTHF